VAGGSICWDLIQVLVHQRILGISHESCYDRCNTAYYPIPFGDKTVYAILSTWVTTWDTACIFVPMPQHLQASDQSSDPPSSPGHILSWPINHCLFANPSWQSRQCRWYWVLGLKYEIWAHLVMVKPLLLLGYDWSSGAQENPGHIAMTDPAQHICQSHLAIRTVYIISNNPSFRLKQPGVPDGSDGCDGTSYPLMKNYKLRVTQATGRVAYSPPLLCAWSMHHQNVTCVTLFAVAAVML